jgi:hypothetical protein
MEEIKDAYDTAVAVLNDDYRTVVLNIFKYILRYADGADGLETSGIPLGMVEINCLFDRYIALVPDGTGDDLAAMAQITEQPVEELVGVCTSCFGLPDMYSNIIIEIYDLIKSTNGARRRSLQSQITPRKLSVSSRGASSVLVDSSHTDSATDLGSSSTSASTSASTSTFIPAEASPTSRVSVDTLHGHHSRRLSETGADDRFATKVHPAAFQTLVSSRPSEDLQRKLAKESQGYFHRLEDGGELGDIELDQNIVKLEREKLLAIGFDPDDAHCMRAFFRALRCGPGGSYMDNNQNDKCDPSKWAEIAPGRPSATVNAMCLHAFPDLNFEAEPKVCTSDDDCNYVGCPGGKCSPDIAQTDRTCICVGTFKPVSVPATEPASDGVYDTERWANEGGINITGAKVLLHYDSQCNPDEDANECDQGYYIVSNVTDTLNASAAPEAEDPSNALRTGWHSRQNPTYSITLSTAIVNEDFHPLSGNREIGIMRMCTDDQFHPVPAFNPNPSGGEVPCYELEGVCVADDPHGDTCDWYLFYQGANSMTIQDVDYVKMQSDADTEEESDADAEEGGDESAGGDAEERRLGEEPDEHPEGGTTPPPPQQQQQQQHELHHALEAHFKSKDGHTDRTHTTSHTHVHTKRGHAMADAQRLDDNPSSKATGGDDDDEDEDEDEVGEDEDNELEHPQTHIGPLLHGEVRPGVFRHSSSEKHPVLGEQKVHYNVEIKPRVFSLDRDAKRVDFVECEPNQLAIYWKTKPSAEVEDWGCDNSGCTVIVGGPHLGCTGGTGSVAADYSIHLGRTSPVLRKVTGKAKTVAAEEWLHISAHVHRSVGLGDSPGIAGDLEAARASRKYANHYVTIVPTTTASYADIFVSADVGWLQDPGAATASSAQKERWLRRNSAAAKRSFPERRVQRAEELIRQGRLHNSSGQVTPDRRRLSEERYFDGKKGDCSGGEGSACCYGKFNSLKAGAILGCQITHSMGLNAAVTAGGAGAHVLKAEIGTICLLKGATTHCNPLKNYEDFTLQGKLANYQRCAKAATVSERLACETEGVTDFGCNPRIKAKVSACGDEMKSCMDYVKFNEDCYQSGKDESLDGTHEYVTDWLGVCRNCYLGMQFGVQFQLKVSKSGLDWLYGSVFGNSELNAQWDINLNNIEEGEGPVVGVIGGAFCNWASWAKDIGQGLSLSSSVVDTVESIFCKNPFGLKCVQVGYVPVCIQPSIGLALSPEISKKPPEGKASIAYKWSRFAEFGIVHCRTHNSDGGLAAMKKFGVRFDGGSCDGAFSANLQTGSGKRLISKIVSDGPTGTHGMPRNGYKVEVKRPGAFELRANFIPTIDLNFYCIFPLVKLALKFYIGALVNIPKDPVFKDPSPKTPSKPQYRLVVKIRKVRA